MSMASTDKSEQLALRAQCVRGAGIAAAGTADIDAAQPPEHEAAEQRTQEIGEERLDREFQHAGDYDIRAHGQWHAA